MHCTLRYVSIGVVLASVPLASCTVSLLGEREISISRAQDDSLGCDDIVAEMSEIERGALDLVPEERRKSVLGRTVTGFDYVLIWPAIELLVEDQDQVQFDGFRERHRALEEQARLQECAGPRDLDDEITLD
jgi:hypothetical protein